MAHRTSIRVERVTDEELRAELAPKLAAFEQTYGRPSSELVEAFLVDDELVETEDFSTWERLYTTWLNAGGTAR